MPRVHNNTPRGQRLPPPNIFQTVVVITELGEVQGNFRKLRRRVRAHVRAAASRLEVLPLVPLGYLALLRRGRGERSLGFGFARVGSRRAEKTATTTIAMVAVR